MMLASAVGQSVLQSEIDIEKIFKIKNAANYYSDIKLPEETKNSLRRLLKSRDSNLIIRLPNLFIDIIFSLSSF